MPRERFFLEQPTSAFAEAAEGGSGLVGSRVVLPKGEAHHLRRVRRVGVGDEVALFDGSGAEVVARVVSFEGTGATLEVVRVERSETEPSVEVTLAAAVLKGAGMDLLVDLCTQLGMKRLVPVQADRSVAKGGKTDRWRRIAIEACKQCGRSVVPEIEGVCGLGDVLGRVKDFDFAVVASLRGKEPLLRAVPAGCKKALVLIGPEGDFTPEEEQAALDAGFVPVSLGPGVLRAETAAAAAMAVVVQAAGMGGRGR